ncbi:MAG: PAS domain S-box-containing protein [Desulforhopalus sp.]
MSIKNKIVAISIAILFIAMGVNTVVTTRYFSNEYLSSRKSEVIVIAETLKSQLDRLLKLHIPLNQLIGFEVMCREAVTKHQAISYAMVVDLEGEILFHNDSSYHNQHLTNDVVLTTIKKGIENIIETTESGEEYYDFFTPVYGSRNEVIAFIRTGFPVNHIRAKTWKLIGYSVAITFLSFVIGCLLLIGLLYHWVSKPVANFIGAIEQIRQKSSIDESQHVDISSQDEIGQLSLAFNQMMDELRRTTVSKEYVDYILENMLNSLIITDENYKVQTVNQETLSLLGYNSEELIGKTIGEVLEIPLEEAMRLSGSDFSVKAIESNYIAKEGKLTPVLFSSSILRDKNDEVQGYICVAQDITEIKVLRGFIPICASCKQIRDDKGYWSQVEKYISEHSKAQFSHSICPDCATKLYPEFVG